MSYCAECCQRTCKCEEFERRKGDTIVSEREAHYGPCTVNHPRTQALWRTACTMHWVLGGVGLWAAQHGIPMAGIAPKALKTFACKVIGVPYTSWKGAKGSRAQAKWGISEAVKVLTGSDESSSDHEADAVLAAFALHGAKLRP